DRIQSRLLAIQDKLDDDAELRITKEKEASAKVHFHSVTQSLKQAEDAVYNQCIKIEQTEASLYSGKGHSPKELQDLQNDITALKHHQATLEDIQLEAMLAVEEAEKINQTIQSKLFAATNSSLEQNQSLHNEKDSLEKELQKLFSERSANADSIPVESLRFYDQLRKQRRGVAVAVISDKSCSACGSGLTPAQIQAARSSSQIALCPSCGRILYGS
ncbi:MAG TPA: C4-type zinc ribbon domain-containing protein, partial [Anaerolineales bacterium]